MIDARRPDRPTNKAATFTVTESTGDTMCKGAKSICLAFLLSLILTPNVLAQGNTHLRVDGERIKEYIRYLSTDEMMGRQSMTPGYQAAAEWVAAQYEAWGLEPAGDDGTFFQQVPISRGLTWYEGVPTLAINGDPLSLVEGDFSIHASSTAGTTVNAEIDDDPNQRRSLLFQRVEQPDTFRWPCSRDAENDSIDCVVDDDSQIVFPGDVYGFNLAASWAAPPRDGQRRHPVRPRALQSGPQPRGALVRRAGGPQTTRVARPRRLLRRREEAKTTA